MLTSHVKRELMLTCNTVNPSISACLWLLTCVSVSRCGVSPLAVFVIDPRLFEGGVMTPVAIAF